MKQFTLLILMVLGFSTSSWGAPEQKWELVCDSPSHYSEPSAAFLRPFSGLRFAIPEQNAEGTSMVKTDVYRADIFRNDDNANLMLGKILGKTSAAIMLSVDFDLVEGRKVRVSYQTDGPGGVSLTLYCTVVASK